MYILESFTTPLPYELSAKKRHIDEMEQNDSEHKLNYISTKYPH